MLQLQQQVEFSENSSITIDDSYSLYASRIHLRLQFTELGDLSVSLHQSYVTRPGPFHENTLGQLFL